MLPRSKRKRNNVRLNPILQQLRLPYAKRKSHNGRIRTPSVKDQLLRARVRLRSGKKSTTNALMESLNLKKR